MKKWADGTLDAEEKEDLKQFINLFMKVKGETPVLEFMISFQSARALYDASKQVINRTPIMIAPLEPDWKKKK